MANRFSTLAGVGLVASIALGTACSARPANQTVVPGGTAGDTSAGGSGTSAGTSAGASGAAGSATAGTSGGVGGATAGTGGAAGTAAMGTCDTYMPVRANYLSPMDDTILTSVKAMSTDRRIEIINGGLELSGSAKYTIDFDGPDIKEVQLNKFSMRDGPRGVHQLVQGGQSTTWAIAEARAASFDVDLETRVGKAQGEEMIALKYDMSLAPTMNVLRHPAWGRAQETYGEDPVLVGEMAAAFVNGMQGGHLMMACPKHFAVNNTENNRHSMNAVVDEQTLRENYVRNFEIMIKKSDPACIMAAYNRVGGLHATENPHLLTQILRTELKWTGFTVSDWWATNVKAGAASLNAGLDYEMPDNQAFSSLASDLAAKNITTDRLNEAAARMINARYKFGQNTDAYKNTPMNTNIVKDAGHIALAQETEEKGAILLKNDKMLPFGPAATKLGIGMANITSIVFAGPDKDIPVNMSATNGSPNGLGDGGSSNTTPPHAVSFIKGLQDYVAAKNLTGVTVSNDATKIASASVVIIPVTMEWNDEGEQFSPGQGQDRADLLLSGAHPKHWNPKPQAYIKSIAQMNPNVVVLLTIGSAVIMEDWFDSAKAVIQTFYAGQEGGTALARLLFGDIDFSGRLPFTIAAAEADYPSFQNNTTGDATIDYFHGYRKIEHDGKTPKFWFGEGLSYNTYAFSKLNVLCPMVSKNGVLNLEVTVTNSGKMAGDEVVQVYIGYPNTKARRPKKELKAFTRVHLNAGEMKTVPLSVPVEDMAYWKDPSGWEVESGVHNVYVGSSAKPTDLQMATFTIK